MSVPGLQILFTLVILFSLTVALGGRGTGQYFIDEETGRGQAFCSVRLGLAFPTSELLPGLPRAFGVHATPQTQSAGSIFPAGLHGRPRLCLLRKDQKATAVPTLLPRSPARLLCWGRSTQPRHRGAVGRSARQPILLRRRSLGVSNSFKPGESAIAGERAGFRSHSQPAVDLRATRCPSLDLVFITHRKVQMG